MYKLKKEAVIRYQVSMIKYLYLPVGFFFLCKIFRFVAVAVAVNTKNTAEYIKCEVN